jgi:enoyl-CoA hydratase
MEESPVLVSREGRVGVVTLNRPKVFNAFNDALMDALGAALLTLDADPGVGAIVIEGNARAFAAGADIAAMADQDYAQAYASNFITRNWETIRQVRKPVIAAVAGLALGGGCELALACDIIVAARGARFALPEIKLGLLPGAGGTQRLPRAVGKAKAFDLCLTGRAMGAEEAERMGLVSRIVEDDALRDTALALAAEIAAYPTLALMALKECLNRSFETSLSEGILFERRELHARFADADAREGVRAFIEKRAPVFRSARGEAP